MSLYRGAPPRAQIALLSLFVTVLLGACGDSRVAAPLAADTNVSSCPTPSSEPSESVGTVTYGTPITPGPPQHETGTLKKPFQSTPSPVPSEIGGSPKEADNHDREETPSGNC